ncbi:hypothetical protein WCX49_01105 [Sulfurimonas sp. HSL-1656]|uniref:hypothetical protein n=1 Tax=Thiomicrolovo subterrani TaxID=3131934 RepID=UPI0031F9B713
MKIVLIGMYKTIIKPLKQIWIDRRDDYRPYCFEYNSVIYRISLKQLRRAARDNEKVVIVSMKTLNQDTEEWALKVDTTELQEILSNLLSTVENNYPEDCI